ncbi:unnamed protein product (macronuclear) [Paramecium tetraurelia]|uniref:H(+)-exporting diphosphatase n=1 Tax=Paramecium tetraurelia TaxID=5888 RepID=A0DXA2_PARTE|nr:uncharacterized protein GSPATT00021301001 [Paramecium tetraurelia]CAK87669.1 unnamed protein product [Paramecium tetraurelia]|eukprot:XP_001455066.1 hypothetical protein (macronuclear) [Paramecium tetraurelia strain d4-2]
MEFVTALVFIFIACACGIVWAIFNWMAVHKLEIHHKHEGLTELLQGAEQEKIETLLEIGEHIQDGAQAFLKEEYSDCSVFLAVMAVLLIFISPWSSLAFVLGAATSMLCGYLGMAIATAANYRTAFSAITSLANAFQMAYRGGCVMGFLLVSISLAILSLIIIIYNAIIVKSDDNNYEDLVRMFDYVAAYGLGGSTFALFGRVGGGIYTKAADVGADLVGKVEKNLPEDSPKNPATIADNVGDNVGDIAGMGADLFGSFAESTCAALVVSSTQLRVPSEGGYSIEIGQLMYPLMVSAFGIGICILVSAYAVYISKVNHINKIESTLKLQLLLSTIALSPIIIGIAYWALPADFVMIAADGSVQLADLKPYHAFICSLLGLWSGLLIGYFTEYMTSHSYTPVREVAKSCGTGAATNIIYGLALGYLSTIVPIIAIAVTALLSMKMLSFYGVALAALGMLSNLTIGLAIDAYGPISDNAGGIAEMSELGENVRESTDALDAAGNTTAAIGKGFAIGSAALVSLSLYGGYLTRIQTYKVGDEFPFSEGAKIDDPIIFAMLLIGAMLPYAFSAFTMKSVGKAALQMVEEVRRQLHEHPGIYAGTEEPDFRACIAISTKASLKEMIPPGLLVIVTPTAVGLLFGPQAVAGLLPGAFVSGVQMAISASNTGGAWDNAKKYIEAGFYRNDAGEVKKKGSDEHKAAVIGDTVGDPLKDTSGPSLNILIKLMAILSLVLAGAFCKTGWLYQG